MSPARLCTHDSEKGGVYTSGDPYRTRRKLGLPEFDFTYFCWDCYKEFGADWAESVREDTMIEVARRGLCGFVEYWVGICLEPNPCTRHLKEKCWKCGKQAVSNCGHTGVLVCGMPQCEEHPHTHQ